MSSIDYEVIGDLEIKARTATYIYMVKFKGLECLKIGWSTDPSKRCRLLGGSNLKVQDLVCVKVHANRGNIQFLEGLFHESLKEYSLERDKNLPTWEGSTEYFNLKAWAGFYSICEALKLKITILR